MSSQSDQVKMEEVRLVIALAILAGLLSLTEYWNTYKASLASTFFVSPLGGLVIEFMNGLVVLILFAFSLYVLFVLFGTISDTEGRVLRRIARCFYAGGGVLVLIVVVLEGLRILLGYV